MAPITPEFLAFLVAVDEGKRSKEYIDAVAQYLIVNDVCTELDLMGLTFDDLTLDHGCSAGQRAWIRRAIDAANKK